MSNSLKCEHCSRKDSSVATRTIPKSNGSKVRMNLCSACLIKITLNRGSR